MSKRRAEDGGSWCGTSHKTVPRKQWVKVQIKMDPEIRAQSEALFKELGLDLSTAFNVFLRKAIRVGGFPFAISLETDDGWNKELKGE